MRDVVDYIHRQKFILAAFLLTLLEKVSVVCSLYIYIWALNIKLFSFGGTGK